MNHVRTHNNKLSPRNNIIISKSSQWMVSVITTLKTKPNQQKKKRKVKKNYEQLYTYITNKQAINNN